MSQSGYPLTEFQKKKGERKLSWWFIVDFAYFPIAHIVDFSTGKIYREYPRGVYPYDLRKNISAKDSIAIRDYHLRYGNDK